MVSRDRDEMSRFTQGPPPNAENMYSLKVDNLTYRTTVDDLKRVFDRYGDVGDIYVPRDPYTKESRGFAFIRYYERRDADDAIDALDGAVLDGREIRVNLAKYGRPDAARRSRGPGRGRRGYSGGYGGRSSGRYRSRSRSRSRSPRRRRKSRSRSRSRDRTRRSRSKSRSGSRSPVNRSNSRNRSASKSRSKSPPPKRERANSKENGRASDAD